MFLRKNFYPLLWYSYMCRPLSTIKTTLKINGKMHDKYVHFVETPKFTINYKVKLYKTVKIVHNW